MEPELSSAAQPPRGEGGPRRTHARVALALLQTLRDRDRPPEILDDENVSHTLPRRFGLSGVVDAQIRRYEEDARRRRRLADDELQGLIRLVTRRSDAKDIFHTVGRSLAGAQRPPVLLRVLPERLMLARGRRRIRHRMQTLFGPSLVDISAGPFRATATSTLLTDPDPDGAACALVSGLCEAILEAHGQEETKVVHPHCRQHGGRECIWTIEDEGPAPGDEADGDTKAQRQGESR